jgi:hypothetical protein
VERTLRRFFFNVSSDRVVVTIKSAPCAPDSVESRMALAEVLQNCLMRPDFLNCDSRFFEKGTIIHDGGRWVFTVEAIVQKTENPNA